MSGVTYEPPTENLAIFDDSVFQVDNAPLTIAKANKLYLKYPNAQGTENMQTTNINGLLTMNAGGVVADTALTFRDAIDDTGIISGVSGSLVLTALNDMTFATNSSGVYPLVLGTDNITMQSNEIVINASDQITIDGGTIDINSGINTITLTGDTINLVSDTITEVKTPNLDIFSPNAFTTYLQLIPTYAAGLADSATLYFGSTTQGTNSYIGIDSLTSMAMAISSTGSIILNSAVDMVQLTNAPSGTVDAAVATVGYVNSGYIPIGQGMPVATVIMWAGAWANLPTGFMLCNGQSVSQTTYADLYAAVGNYYGVAVAGNFLLPNLVNTFPIGSTSGGATTYPYSTILGSALSNGGSSTISLNQIPSHSHGIIGNNTGTGGGSSVVINPSGTAGTATQPAGEGQAYAPPFQALQFLIKY